MEDNYQDKNGNKGEGQTQNNPPFPPPIFSQGEEDAYEKILSQERHFQGRVFSADVLEVSLPDGSLGRREIVRHNGGAAIVPLDKDNNVYMVRQFRIPFEMVLLEIPAGKLEKDEDPELCASRELKEETGFLAEKIESLGSIFPSPGYCGEVLHLFLATGLTAGEMALDEGEFLTVEKIPLQRLLEKIDQGLIRDAKTVIALLKTARRLGL